MDVPVSVAEAALGASVVVPAPDGTKVRVRVPKGTQDDTVLSVRGKGAQGEGRRLGRLEDHREGGRAQGDERRPEEGHGRLFGGYD